MGRVIFVDNTRVYRKSYEKYVWLIVGIMSVFAFVMFVFYPEYIILP